MKKKPLMLMILDGWGLSDCNSCVDAIKNANPLEFKKLISTYPFSKLEASGEAVGLPFGQMGNSEVGHLNIGAGRVIYQPLVEISKDIKDGSFFKKESLVAAFNLAKNNNSSLHFGGLVSDGGVHSHIKHLFGLLEMAKHFNLKKVYIHAFLDGRDTPPSSGSKYLKDLESKIEELQIGKIATISGRYFAMDRDQNWERTEKAYNNMTLGTGNVFTSTREAISSSYANNITDEFVEPSLINKDGLIKENDIFINFNFRPDRARQITRALTDENFSHFERKIKPVKVFCMRQYDTTINAPIIYEDAEIANTLGEVISKAGLTQFRTAETEKYAHITFFLNGGKETQYPGEERSLIPSPKVATYDLQPEMSAAKVAESALNAINSEKYDVFILNFANPDMVGHTGILNATEKAIATVDKCMKLVVNQMLKFDGTILITADHGNAELMVDPKSNAPYTAHTTNLVPFIYVSNDSKEISLKNGKLADIAPTMLKILNIDIPKEMTGNILIK